jgi:protein-tyrosine kinase
VIPGGRSVRSARARPSAVAEHLVSLLVPGSFEAEQYRVLRHVVDQRRRQSDLRVLAVTSAAVGDGKTTTSINLAGALGQAPNARVLLVDGDLRCGAIPRLLGLRDDSHGLADAIADSALTLSGLVHACPQFNLTVLPAGRRALAPYELVSSARLGSLLEEARQHYDYVVLDTPPLVPVPDARLMAKWVDGVLLVVAANKTPRKLVEEALHAVEPAKLLGLVFNSDDRPLFGYSNGYGYYYGSRHGGRHPWWGRLAHRLRLARAHEPRTI